MSDEPQTLGFGETYNMVAAKTACGRLLTLTSNPGNESIPPHRHANDYLCIVLGGAFAETHGKGCVERLGGDFFLHHAGELHYDCFGSSGAKCLNLHFTVDEPGPSAGNGRCSTDFQIAANRLALELVRGFPDDLVMAALAAEILAEADPRPGCTSDGAPWLGRIIEAISDEPRRRWTLGELAGIADRHPVHLAKSFRARTGYSLGTFQRIRRLVDLSIQLREGSHPLALLAADYGYYDQAHMTHEFRRAFGVSPGNYRRDTH